ncbi:MAG: helix-turn-helix domain-containing protein [Planctomycetaceae bacterium]|nr:helix-turn-helix domain-containing protein [Planctomycetaceae bacterium]
MIRSEKCSCDSKDEAKEGALLIGAEVVASMLDCSPRHIRRLVDAGAFPRPVKLGTKLVRWPRRQIEDFIAGGCRATGKAV